LVTGQELHRLSSFIRPLPQLPHVTELKKRLLNIVAEYTDVIGNKLKKKCILLLSRDPQDPRIWRIRLNQTVDSITDRILLPVGTSPEIITQSTNEIVTLITNFVTEFK